MDTTLPGVKAHSQTDWQALYHMALSESDHGKVLARINEAEGAILSRMKELAGLRGDHIEEEAVLDDALYALRALRNTTIEFRAA